MSPTRPPKQCRRGHRYTGRHCDQCVGWTERKPSSWKSGAGDSRWRAVRAERLELTPVCVNFGTDPACTGVATTADHLDGTDYRDDSGVGASWLNLAMTRSMCDGCHARRTGRQGGRARWGKGPT